MRIVNRISNAHNSMHCAQHIMAHLFVLSNLFRTRFVNVRIFIAFFSSHSFVCLYLFACEGRLDIVISFISNATRVIISLNPLVLCNILAASRLYCYYVFLMLLLFLQIFLSGFRMFLRFCQFATHHPAFISIDTVIWQLIKWLMRIVVCMITQ